MGGRILMAKIYLQFNENNEVIAWAFSRGNEVEVEFELDEMHPIFTRNPFYFKLVNGELMEAEGKEDAIREKRKKEREVFELKNYLKESDFYFIRKMDEGTSIPGEVQSKRAQARKRLKELGQ